jgi:hypothetical protein
MAGGSSQLPGYAGSQLDFRHPAARENNLTPLTPKGMMGWNDD